jgi:hypothetical protein
LERKDTERDWSLFYVLIKILKFMSIKSIESSGKHLLVVGTEGNFCGVFRLLIVVFSRRGNCLVFLLLVFIHTKHFDQVILVVAVLLV